MVDSNAQADSTETDVERLTKELKDKEARYVYLYAEFENYKKRAQKERQDLLKFGWESPARELLQVVDNLERALEHAPATTDKTLLEGLKLVLGQFLTVLEKQGIKRVVTLKQNFDPDFHEAVGQEVSNEPNGTIVKEHQSGYTLHGRLLRPARVLLSSGPAN